MKKILCFLCLLAGTLLLTSCSSLPEGAEKPGVKITDLFITTNNNTPGFEIGLSVHHNSPGILPAEALHIEISLNGRLYASYDEDDLELQLSPGVTTEIVRFVPANQAGPAARDALTYNSMLSADAYCKVQLLIEDNDEQDLNPEIEYRGIIYNVLSK